MTLLVMCVFFLECLFINRAIKFFVFFLYVLFFVLTFFFRFLFK